MKARFALVTGGAGFIGSHLVDRLVSDCWKIRVLDNFSDGRMEGNREIFNNELVVVEKAPVKTWSEVVRQYLGKLY